MKQLVGLALITSAFLPTRGAAEIFELICENPRREYNLTFDSNVRTVKVDDTDYRVLAIEKSAGAFMVAGTTVNDGPTYRLHLRPYLKMEYFIDGELFQTDGCYRTD